MRSKQVVLELLPGRIDVVRFDGGKPGAAERIAVSLPNDHADWMAAVLEHGRQLHAAVERLDAVGASCTVLYRSPTQSLDLSAYPLKPQEARSAAELEMLGGLLYTQENAVCRSIVARRDGSPGNSHVVVVAEHDETAECLMRLVEAAGMEFGRAVPIDAMTMTRLVGCCGRRRADSGMLSIGEHASFFLVVEGGALVFARQIGIGLATITTGLTRPIRSGGNRIELDAETARRILHEHGRPKPGQVIDQDRGIMGHHLIPMTQPVLQRLVVELRQSLRFGLTPEQRESLKLTLTGPGATVPGLAELLGGELGVEVNADGACRDYRWTEPGCPGSELAEAMGQRRTLESVGLEPMSCSLRRGAKKMQRHLWVGAATALLIVIGAWLHYQGSLTEVRKQIQSLEDEESSQQILQTTSARLTAVVAALNELDQRIDHEMGLKPSYRAVMQELSRMTPSSVRFNLVRINRADDQTQGLLSGFAFDGGGGRTDLEPFIESLRASPLVEDIGLDSVQQGVAGERTGERFLASFMIVAAPRHIPTQVAADTTEGEMGEP